MSGGYISVKSITSSGADVQCTGEFTLVSLFFSKSIMNGSRYEDIRFCMKCGADYSLACRRVFVAAADGKNERKNHGVLRGL